MSEAVTATLTRSLRGTDLLETFTVLRGELAQFSKLVSDAAGGGDAVALGIFQRAGAELAAIADAVGTPVYVYSTATLARHVAVFREALAGLDDTDLRFASLERGLYAQSTMEAAKVRDETSLIALRLSDEELDIDHGYPCRVIAAARPGVHQTKWVTRIEAA